MTAYLSTELGGSANQTSAPVGYKPAATVYRGRLKRLRATYTMASQASTDTLVVGVLPAGSTFAFGVVNASATLGSTTVAIGPGTSTGKYRAAATFTGAVPTLFGVYSAVDDDPLTADEQVIATLGAAAMPSSGTFIIDLYYSEP